LCADAATARELTTRAAARMAEKIFFMGMPPINKIFLE
jgi:hypothetical protein